MTRITSSDQVLLLLREQLQRMGKSRNAAAPAAVANRGSSKPALSPVQALAARGGLDEEEFKRTLVRAMLTEQFGEQVAQDPALQSIFEDVFRVVAQDEDGARLLENAADQLKRGA